MIMIMIIIIINNIIIIMFIIITIIIVRIIILYLWYIGVGDALFRILKEEGMRGVFTGAGPTIIRAMSLNLGMLTSNE